MSRALPDHRRALAAELLDDIELARLSTEKLLLKASRLAYLGENDEVKRWIQFELNGFIADDEVSLERMTSTNRWTNRTLLQGFTGPLAEIEGQRKAKELQLQQLALPTVQVSTAPANRFDSANTATNTAVGAVIQTLNRMTVLANEIGQLSGIQSRVLAQLHDFVAAEYYKLEFSGHAETIFDKHKRRVDTVLGGRAGDAVEKIPAVYDRLAAGDREAISQALNTCRRIINAFADAVYPAPEKPVARDGKPVEVGNDKTLNRINEYVNERTSSSSRRERIRKTLKHLYDRVCAGVHDDVTLDEAMALFLQTYLTLGEIALLEERPVLDSVPAAVPLPSPEPSVSADTGVSSETDAG